MLDALGIVNIEDSTVDVVGLQKYRPTSAISIFGRYRVIDFILSNMTNSGINDIQVYCKDKPRSLIEHLGTGLHYNINSKKGSLKILFSDLDSSSSEVYNHDIMHFMQNMQFIEESNKKYVVLAPSYIIYRVDFEEVLKQHIQNENDITILYKNVDNAKEDFIGCDCLTLDKDKKIISIDKNRGKYKNRNISLEAYVLSKELFIKLVELASKTSSLYWFKDILSDVVLDYKVEGYSVKGVVSCINSLNSYYQANMKYCSRQGINTLKNDSWKIHTMTNDSAPTIYGENSNIKNSIIANGCKIDGKVENCVLGRNVVIKKGAVVKNSVLLHNVVIGEDVKVDYSVVDKGATIDKIKKVSGTNQSVMYIRRRDNI